MNVYLLHHVSHPDGQHTDGGEVRIDEGAGDDVKLLGCYSSAARASDRISRAQALPGFGDEPNCFVVSRYELDRDEWTTGYVSVD